MPADSVIDSSSLIRDYYAAFNERRFVDAAAMFAPDAVVEQLPLQRQERGGIGYLQFVSVWLRAFPNAILKPRQIVARQGDTYEINLSAVGAHRGALELGGWVFRPTGVNAELALRELLELRNGQIVFSSLSFNLHELVDKLAQVDVPKLLEHVDRLRALSADLREAPAGSMRSREIADAMGDVLDAARHVVRPYYKRR